MHFNGSQDVTISDNSTLTMPDGDFTFGFWYRYENTSPDQVVMSWGGYGQNPAIFIYYESSSPNDSLVFVIGDDDSTGTTSFYAGPLSADTWYHTIWRRSGTTHTLYIGGTLEDTYSSSSFDGINRAADMVIGGTGTADHVGDIAEFFKVNRALNTDEIMALANGARPNQIIGDFGTTGYYYPLEINGADLSGNGNSGTVNGATVGDHPPVGPYIRQNTILNWINSGGGSHSIIGSVSLGVTSSSSMNVGRSFSGSGSLGITANSGMSTSRSLEGAASLGMTSSASLSVGRSLSGSADLGLTGNSSMNVSRTLVGSVDLGLTSNTPMSVRRVLLGDVSLGLDSNSQMSVGRVLIGLANIGLASNSSMAVMRVIVGNVPLGLSSAATMNFGGNKSIIGSADLGLTSNTPMSVRRALSGSANISLAGNAQLNVGRVLVGSATLSLLSNPTMAVTRVLSGDVSLGLDSNSQMSVSRALVGSADLGLTSNTPMSVRRAIVGSAVFGIFPSAVMAFNGTPSIIGSVSLRLTSASSLAYQGIKFTPNAFRTLIVDAEDRFLKIGEENRMIKVQAEDRYLEV